MISGILNHVLINITADGLAPLGGGGGGGGGGGVLLCVYTDLLSNEGNKHQNNTRVSA